MIPAPPAIHYRVTVMCGESPCALPVHAQMFGGGGSPTPVPWSFTRIRLALSPEPAIMPPVTWKSRDESIVVARSGNPFEGHFRFSDDTAATPEPDPLATLLVPGPLSPQYVGTSRGVTTVEADVGAPVNERITIPVYTTGRTGSRPPDLSRTPAKVIVARLAGTSHAIPFKATIAYADPIISTYGSSSVLFTEAPWSAGAGGFRQTFGSVRVAVSPQPYSRPSVSWSIDGDAATLSQQNYGTQPLDTAYLRGIRPGRATIHARVGAPVNEEITAPLIVFPTLVLACPSGVRFDRDGSLQRTSTPEESDLFLDCGTLHVPGGGVMVTNGDDPSRTIAQGAIRGPQFPDLGGGPWTNAFTTLNLDGYRTVVAPGNGAMPARTLLFRTRDGRFVKWLIQIGNGLDTIAGPYQVL